MLIIVFLKVLLRHGANPELRDDDGKTPLDKARERNDDGHKEVVRILQSPGIFSPSNNFRLIKLFRSKGIHFSCT